MAAQGYGKGGGDAGYGKGGASWRDVAPTQALPVGPLARFDAQTEAALDQWVEAKRKRNFELADSIRFDLRAQGIDPDTARPSDMDSGGKGHGKSSSAPGPGTRFDAEIEAKLDLWVESKRIKDFATADEIRSELRAMNIDPDTVRPAAGRSTLNASSRFDAQTEAKLDQWVQAKRDRDFATADMIRDEMRTVGIDPDVVRPADKQSGGGKGYGSSAAAAFGGGYGSSYGSDPVQAAFEMGFQMASGMNAGAERHDARTEAELDQWVAAKRAGDFTTADMIRSSLRSRGINPDDSRPSNQGMQSSGPAWQQPGSMGYDSQTEAQLDRWVEAKRKKDFATADAIRKELRAKGVNPDDVRPPGEDLAKAANSAWSSGGYGAWPASGGMSSSMMGGQSYDDGRYDAQTEAKLDQWVEAKRSKDFATADALRQELRSNGIEPDTARPGYRDSSSVSNSNLPQGQQWQINQQLDRWVEAKRAKDFATADSIRQMLRDQGVDPDRERPSDRGDGGPPSKRWKGGW